MTTKDSILALAAKISNDTVPNVTTDAQALGELAKAMCGTAPEVPLATVDDAIAFITANYSGGGGDFTIATVTLQAGADYANAMSLNCSCIGSNGTVPSFYTNDTSAEFPVVLYKGVALAACTLDATITTTGNVSYGQSGLNYIITGDCTFTFTGGK